MWEKKKGKTIRREVGWGQKMYSLDSCRNALGYMLDKTDVIVWILILKDRIEIGKQRRKEREKVRVGTKQIWKMLYIHRRQ